MAPMEEDTVENNLKDVIQDLFEIQSATHAYLGPETQNYLVQKITTLTSSLSKLSSTSASISTAIPPDIISYVEEGRNPDIYTREFVELVQRRNAFLRGKIEAFKGFAEILEEEMKSAGIAVESGKETETAEDEVKVKREEG